MQQQRVKTQAPPIPAATAAPRASSSSSGGRGDDERERLGNAQPETDFPSENPFEHWASPAEVMQMRALWADVIQRHRNETDQLKLQMQRIRDERDALAKEVSETENLRQLYAVARREYDQMKNERDQWKEEREMLVLRLQRLNNESMAAKEEASRMHELTRSELSSVNSATVEEAMLLHEELRRVSQELMETQHRREFERVVESATTAQLERSLQLRIHELQLVKSANEGLKNDLLTANADRAKYGEEIVHLKGEVRQAHAKAQGEIDAVKADCQDQIAAAARTASDAEQDLLDRNKVLEQQLHKSISEGAAVRESLADSLNQTVFAKQESESSATKLHERLEGELAELRSQLHATNQKHADELRSQQQQVIQARSMLQQTQQATDELIAEKVTLAGKLEDATAQVNIYQVEAERLSGFNQQATVRVEALQQQLEAMRSVKVERDSFEARAVHLEADLKAQLEFYERQMKESYTAIEMLQRKHEEHTGTLLKQIRREKKLSRERDAHQGKKKSSSSREGTPKEASPEPAADGSPELKPAVDVTGEAARQMQETRKTFERLARSVSKSLPK